MIDEAFIPFEQIIERLISFSGEITDDMTGVRLYIDECEIESPVEMDIVRDERGGLRIGSTPPLYYVNTTFKPSFHKLRFIVQRSEATFGPIEHAGKLWRRIAAGLAR